MSQATILEHPQHGDDGGTRRDFLYLATAAMGAVGTAIAVWPFIDSMNPAGDVLALSAIEIDLAPIQAGQRVTVNWRGNPLFIDHRTPEQIARAKADDAADLPDPEADGARVQREEWLVVVGVCTHLGCIPKGQRAGDPVGSFGGWLCVCHGSHYDTSGRIRKGPAPKNLMVPPYEFLDGQMVKIG